MEQGPPALTLHGLHLGVGFDSWLSETSPGEVRQAQSGSPEDYQVKQAGAQGVVYHGPNEDQVVPDSTEGKRVAKSLGVKSGECILHARGYAFKHLDQVCVQSSCGASHAVAAELGSENPELILLCCSKDHCIRRGRHHYLGRGVRSMREFGCGDGQVQEGYLWNT